MKSVKIKKKKEEFAKRKQRANTVLGNKSYEKRQAGRVQRGGRKGTTYQSITV